MEGRDMNPKKGLARKPMPFVPYIKDPTKVPTQEDEALAKERSLPRLRARLAKGGEHVVCGRINCGARFAEVSENHIHFLPGWAPRRDEVWELSKYARDKIRRQLFKGLPPKPKLRRYPKNAGVVPNDVMDSYFITLPVAAVCPTCGFLNAIRSEDVSANLVLTIITTP